jgi:uncharacterized protein YndB with AHSA1/START domain
MWKRALLIAGIAVVLVLLLVFVAGGFIPRTHVASSTLVVDAPIDSVWTAIRNFEELPSIWAGLDRVERVDTSSTDEVWMYYRSTGPMAIAIESAEPPHRLVTRIVADEESSAFGGTWTYALAPEGEGTRVTVTEAGFINSRIFRVVSKIIGVHGTMDSFLRSLGAHYGGEAEPEHLPSADGSAP